jgi:hypothetical protein
MLSYDRSRRYKCIAEIDSAEPRDVRRCSQGRRDIARQNHQLSIIAQNLIEFWGVATRPMANNGLALSIAETASHVKTFERTFNLLADRENVFLSGSDWSNYMKFAGGRFMTRVWLRR